VKSRFASIIALILLFSSLVNFEAFAQDSQVHAVLFYSPECQHCQEVMQEFLPPIVEKYEGQIDIVGIDVTHTIGQNLYQSAVIKYSIPDSRIGVPTLIIGDVVLVGSYEIPEKFPSIVKEGLAKGGINWPDIPGLQTVLDSQDTNPVSKVTNSAVAGEETPGFIDRFMQDPLANSIAVIILIGMIICLIIASASFIRDSEKPFIRFPGWTIPVLSIIGLGIAFYLSFIETTNTEALCGPVGNCNSVQQSPYAYVFGLIPVGAIGVAGYAVILAFWIFQRISSNGWKKLFTILIWGAASFGVLFSIYLTFLEPFVIGASCMWCLSSAVLITLIMFAATEPARASLKINDEEIDEDQEQDISME